MLAPSACRCAKKKHASSVLVVVVGCGLQLWFAQDRKVWEHKLHVAPRNLVAGDGPFAAYGRWLDQVRLRGVRSLVSLLLV